MPPFEIVGRPQNLQTNQMFQTLIQAKGEQDRLALARKELEQRAREEALNRAAQITNTELEQKLMRDRESQADKHATATTKLTSIRKLASGINNLDDFNSLLPAMKEVFSDGEVESYRNQGLNRERELTQSVMQAQSERHALELQERANIGDWIPGGYGQVANQEQLNIEQQQIDNQTAQVANEAARVKTLEEGNRIENRKVDTMFDRLKLDKEIATDTKVAAYHTLQSDMARTRGNIMQVALDRMPQILTDSISTPEVRLANLVAYGSMVKQAYAAASSQLKALNGNINALAQSDPVAAQMLEGLDPNAGELDMGVLIEDLIDSAIKTMEKQKNNAGITAAKEVRSIWRKEGGGYQSPVNVLADWLEREVPSESAILGEYLLQEFGKPSDLKTKVKKEFRKPPTSTGRLDDYVDKNMPFRNR